MSIGGKGGWAAPFFGAGHGEGVENDWYNCTETCHLISCNDILLLINNCVTCFSFKG